MSKSKERNNITVEIIKFEKSALPQMIHHESFVSLPSQTVGWLQCVQIKHTVITSAVLFWRPG